MKYKIITLIIFTSLILFTTNFALASSKDVEDRLYGVGVYAEYEVDSFEGAGAIALYIGNIISYILAMLGVIFLVLLIYGGFLWMTAGGDSEEVTKAKDIMYNAVIGLIIVLMSYAISYYVVSKVASTTMTSF